MPVSPSSPHAPDLSAVRACLGVRVGAPFLPRASICLSCPVLGEMASAQGFCPFCSSFCHKLIVARVVSPEPTISLGRAVEGTESLMRF